MTTFHRFAQRHPLILYFILAYAITWGFSTLAVIMTGPVAGIGSLLFLFGPAISALIVSGAAEGRQGLMTLLRRLTIWRVGLPWWVFILAYGVISHLVVVGISYAISGRIPEFFASPEVPSGISPLIMTPILVGTLFLRVGVAEELGWRGFALPRMLESPRSALVSSLILGVLWACWHFHPLNFPIISKFGVWYVLGVTATTVIFTWVFQHTNGSVLIAALFHAALNSAEYVVPLGLHDADTFRFAINALVGWAVVLLIVLLHGTHLMGRRERGADRSHHLGAAA